MRKRSMLVQIALLIGLLIVPLHVIAKPPSSSLAQTPSSTPPVYLPLITNPPPVLPLPTFDYAVAMREGYKHDVDRPDLPHYDLTMHVDPIGKRINGRVELWFRNMTGVSLPDVVLRLYPNFPPDYSGDGGDTTMTVSNVVAQDAPVAPRYEAQNTAVRIALPQAAAPNDVIRIALDFTSNFGTNYPQDRSFQLPSFYPMLAVWQNGWRTDVSTFPDRVYASSALYHAKITAPRTWTIASTGSALNTFINFNGSRTFEVVSGPVREFAFSVGQFASVQAEHEGVEIVVWYEENSGLATVAANSVEHLKHALTTFNQKYGPYPFRSLETHLVFNTSSYNHGLEFPGLIYIVTNGSYTTNTRLVVSHELAHQWFYGVLGNDIFNEPWLDESFAHFSPYLVEAQWHGQAASDSYYQNQIKAVADRTTRPVGLSVWEYASWREYYNAIYGRGSLFLYTLRGRIGDAAFLNGLQAYYAKHKYGIVHKADFLAAMERSSGQDLDPFFLQWLGH